jgi:tripartite ATP-independent transporter DctP family solute receptor
MGCKKINYGGMGMKKTKKSVLIVISSLLALMVFVAGCSKNTANDATKSPDSPPSDSKVESTEDVGEPIVMKLGHTLSQVNHYNLTAQEFARIVKEKTKGKIDVQLFPSSQLGGEVRMIQALQTGAQELVLTSQAPVANLINKWSVFDLPYLFDSIDQGNHVLQGPVGQKYLDMLEEQNLVGLTWISVSERNIISTKKAVKNVEDMKNLKVRVLQSPGYVDVYKALGANPTPMPYGELYLSMQQGVVDGADIGADYMVQDKFPEVTDNFSLTRVHYMPVAMLISKVTWDKLTPELQQAVKEAAQEAAKYDLDVYKQQYNTGIEEMKKLGVNVIEIDTKPWIEATEAVRKNLIGKITDGESLYKEIQEAKK